jgi:hypothetical protein
MIVCELHHSKVVTVCLPYPHDGGARPCLGPLTPPPQTLPHTPFFSHTPLWLSRSWRVAGARVVPQWCFRVDLEDNMLGKWFRGGHRGRKCWILSAE